ncbi:protein of unknown function (plasmid) [Shinella sp. WSC3-e]|nr:hypothetical protein SHINE37_30004 [Rhizobiaceae bacterium]CAK7261240.1 protein of unknown function [Shinella sp. WSC3-e]
MASGIAQTGAGPKMAAKAASRGIPRFAWLFLPMKDKASLSALMGSGRAVRNSSLL